LGCRVWGRGWLPGLAISGVLGNDAIGSCRGTSLIRTPPLLGPYSRTIPRVLWWSRGEGGLFLMSEVPL